MAAYSTPPAYWSMDPDGTPTHPDAEVPIPEPGQERALLATIAAHGWREHREPARIALALLDAGKKPDRP